ncbi:MAG: N-acetylmuramoyl-L-alanine amidase [Myxococcales bacterium]|nr:N-acetylmuramoyl-L-alanine amidase [Myxococcales bacterium]
MRTTARAAFLLCLSTGLWACTAGDARLIGEEADDVAEAPPVDEKETLAEGTDVQALFEDAAIEFGVPAPVLEAMAWAETRFEMVSGEVEFEGQEPAYGIMALRGESLQDGAALAGVSVEEAAGDLAQNIRAAAALLAQHGADTGASLDDLGSWAEAAVALSGLEDEIARDIYVHREVFATLQAGVVTEQVALEPHEVVPKFIQLDGNTTPGPDYGDSVWRPTSKHSARPSGAAGDPSMVIIHSCEGSYSSCLNTLTTSSAQVSAHYVVNGTGSEISQMVRENRKAWHIGATYKCSRNGNVRCDLNGYGSNGFTVGIEHAGFASQSSWPQNQLDASARLVCDIATDHGITIDKFHVVGHGQLQPYNRTDPGKNWPWASFLASANAFCNQGGGTGGGGTGGGGEGGSGGGGTGELLTIVVDSNNGANGSDAQCIVSGNWTASNNVSGYYNTGYWWRSTGSTTDAARFEAFLDAPRKMVVETWYPAASDRSPSTPFVISDAGGNQLDTVYVDQRFNGGKWVTLGTYDFTAGWNTVAVSRWTDPGDVVVADAVRFREVP